MTHLDALYDNRLWLLQIRLLIEIKTAMVQFSVNKGWTYGNDRSSQQLTCIHLLFIHKVKDSITVIKFLHIGLRFHAFFT